MGVTPARLKQVKECAERKPYPAWGALVFVPFYDQDVSTVTMSCRAHACRRPKEGDRAERKMLAAEKFQAGSFTTRMENSLKPSPLEGRLLSLPLELPSCAPSAPTPATLSPKTLLLETCLLKKS